MSRTIFHPQKNDDRAPNGACLSLKSSQDMVGSPEEA